MTTDDAVSRTRYRFGPLEKRGLVAGWRGGQIASVSAGLVVGVIAVRADPSVAGALLALFAVGVSVAAAMWPLAGRTAEQWAPDALRHASVSLRRVRADRADPFASVRVLPVDLETTEVPECERPHAAVVADLASSTYAASFEARTSGFILAGAHEKERNVAAWAAVLSSLAREGSPVHRIQWTCRNLGPRTDGRLASAPATGGRGTEADGNGRMGPQQAARRSYATLLDAEAAVVQDRETLLTLSIDARKSLRAVRSAGGGHKGACALVLREAAALRRRLGDAGITSGTVLSPERLEHLVRRSFDPARDAPNSSSGAGNRRSQWPWPMAVRSEWAWALVEDTFHATYWISEWPRLEVGPDFLGPLLLLRDVSLSVSVVMEPMSPSYAVRKLENARTADVADAELRRRGGFLDTARRRREEQMLGQRELELADGHAPYRFSGYASVAAGSIDSLSDARSQVEQAASRCGLELRLCYGAQAFAYSTTLPLCRGLA